MLDSFRRKDTPRVPRSPYTQLQEALTPAAPVEMKREVEIGALPEIEPEQLAQPEPGKGIDAIVPEPGSVSRLIVGPDFNLKGAEITDCDTLVVEGRVEASVDGRVIQIAEHGVIVGKVAIDIAEIRGRFEGDLMERKHLVIRATGQVSGKIRYGTIPIEEGGELSGDVASHGANGNGAQREPERKPNGASSSAPLPRLFAREAGAAH